jgi:hypothetical protein
METAQPLLNRPDSSEQLAIIGVPQGVTVQIVADLAGGSQ